MIVFGLIILGILIIIGLIRAIRSPSRNFLEFIIELLWIDFLIDALAWVIKAIVEILADD